MRFFRGKVIINEKELEGLSEEAHKKLTEMPKDWRQLIQTKVLPAWVNYLNKKREKEVEVNEFAEIRTDTVGK